MRLSSNESVPIDCHVKMFTTEKNMIRVSYKNTLWPLWIVSSFITTLELKVGKHGTVGVATVTSPIGFEC